VHPAVRRLAREHEALAGVGQLVVQEIPLLFEGEAWKRFDANVLVVAPREARIARVIARDAVTAEAVEARMAAQIDPARAREMAGYVIENDEDVSTLRARADAVYDALLARAHD
jgi:dephospho-CoA kinase